MLLTRFNLPSKGHESIVRAKENWLRDRVSLFERYCLPTVLGQSEQSFTWIVYLDPQSPGWLMDWVRGHEAQRHFHPVLREEVPRRVLLADIQAITGSDGRGDLLTTNLDNDDGLARDFIARLQSAPTAGDPTAVYLGDGLIISGERLYRRTDPHNAFCSVRESWRDPVTCWSEWHNRLPELMPAVVLRGAPGWLQVVHGANVSNRVRGRRTPPAPYRPAFPRLLDEVADPGRADLLREAAQVPLRQFRELARAGVKAAVVRLLGKDGLDRAKHRWASVGGRHA
ncbi:glycosyltransferase [Geodermatophilus normandii]|uniref:glycosyltransferase n=1 Tax=Geodermatophilus normandii TaxID=1137989 RepID=UPI001B8855D0|nr:glycosyltransferase [Geodermatophilus normandii]